MARFTLQRGADEDLLGLLGEIAADQVQRPPEDELASGRGIRFAIGGRLGPILQLPIIGLGSGCARPGESASASG
jgi:hypothetical protein